MRLSTQALADSSGILPRRHHLRAALGALTLSALLLCACASQDPRPVASAQITVLVTDDLRQAFQRAQELAARWGPDRVLLAFDLDNTLLAMSTELGADQWYDWQKELAQSDPCDIRLVADRLAVQGALYHLGSMRLTQPGIPDLLRDYRASGSPMMIITSRGSGFRLSTFRELRRHGMSFRDSAPGPVGGFIEDLSLAGASRPLRYEDGVLMVAGQDKGQMLLALLAHLGLKVPAAVVFADDKEANIQAMGDALEAAGIHAALYRYSREDRWVDAFNVRQVARDWDRLAPALPAVQAVMGNANFTVSAASRNPACFEP